MGDRWIWFMLLGLHVLHEATSMSTCKSVDMEQVKKRRIEAIRGQILSKLKLTKAPDVESENMTLPEHIFSIYNSTVETIKEFTEKVDRLTSSHSEKEYYGKEVQKISMDPNSSELSKGKDGLLFIFSAVSVRDIVKDATLLHQVELRMYRKMSSNDNKELRMELYRDLGNNSFRYLDSKFFLTGGDEWLSFDVTQTVREWMNNKEKNEGFKLSLACACEKSDEDDKKLIIEGFSKIRGDLKELTEKSLFTPYLLITYIPEARMENGHSSRTKRALDGEYCQSNPGSNCCVKTLYINFRKDLGWKWIHEPKGYEANYCLGNCPYIWGMDTQYSRVLSLYNQNNPGASISPCCVPDVLDPLPIIYYVGRQAKVEKLSNMVVRSCHCS